MIRLQHRPVCQTARSRSGTMPHGLSLLEVLISIAIFAGVMGAIGQLVSNGVRSSIRAKLESQAVLRAETVLSEIVAGALPCSNSEQTFSDDPAWKYRVSIGGTGNTSVFLVEVTAIRGGGTAGEISQSLQRYVRDPETLAQLQDNAEKLAEEKAATTSSLGAQPTTSTGGGSSTGSGGAGR